MQNDYNISALTDHIFFIPSSVTDFHTFLDLLSFSGECRRPTLWTAPIASVHLTSNPVISCDHGCPTCDHIIILITAVLYSAPSRKSTQERSQPNLGQTMWS